MTPSLDGLTPHDCLYLSPHAEDAALSCPGAMLEERGRGLSVLVVTLFGADPGMAERFRRPTARLGAEQLLLELPEASRRRPCYGSFHSVLFERDPADEATLLEAERALAEIARRVKPRHVYLPLGVWGHVDHRIAHDASRRVFEPGAERDVFFYEERPYSLLRSVVRQRLAELGARLPPAAAAFPDDAGLLRFLLGFHAEPFVRRHFRGFLDSLGATGRAARQWRNTRGWRPLKAFGPRLQPALHPVPEAALEILRQAGDSFPKDSPFGSTERLLKRMARHGRRLGQAGPVERYWLLLPQREEERLAHPLEEARLGSA